jgi:hypothetical protein
MLVAMEATKPRNTRYIAALAVAATLILVVGWLARPRDLPQSAAPIPSATELEQLARRAERRSLESRTEYFAALARDLASPLVHLTPLGTTGVVWDATRIVTAPVPPEHGLGHVSASLASQVLVLQSVIRGPHLPLAVLEAPASFPSIMPVRLAASTPGPGNPILAIWRSHDAHAFVTGTYGQVTTAVCGTVRVDEIVSSIFHAAPSVGGAVFNLDGGLLGVILPCNGRFAAISATSVNAILQHGNTLPQRLLGRYGFTVATDGRQAQAMSPGLLVSEVWIESVADRAGLNAGDVIVAVNDAVVANVEDLGNLLAPSQALLTLTVRRGSRRVELALRPDADGRPSHGVGALGVVWRASQGRYNVASVLPGVPAATAGLQAGDRVIRVDYVEPRNLTHLERMLSASPVSSSRVIEIERDGRRLAIILQ